MFAWMGLPRGNTMGAGRRELIDLKRATEPIGSDWAGSDRIGARDGFEVRNSSAGLIF